MVPERLGRILIGAQLITEVQLQKALAVQKREGGRLGGILVRLGFIKEEILLGILAKQLGVPSVDLAHLDVDPAVVKLIPVELLKKHTVFPLKRVGSTLSVAIADPADVFAIDDIKFTSGYHVEPSIASESAILKKIEKFYGNGAPIIEKKKAVAIDVRDYTVGTEEGNASDEDQSDESLLTVEDFDEVVGDALDNIDVEQEAQEEGVISDVGAPIIKLVNGILVNGINVGASDIHVEPFATVLRVRLRIDGVLKTVMSLPVKIKNAMVSRLKIMAGLDIAERRLPQDGRIKLRLGKGRAIDFRVSTIPCLFGEKVALRILDSGNLSRDLSSLGFEPQALADFKQALDAPYGMILVTGPTGSGKTTTLYSALKTINTTEVNISTAEDPVEYNLMGINQVQMKEDIGLTFATALRSFLRQDPDVILVGEIRDQETAEIGIKAALTGHLVLSTLHTNDATSAVTRLVNMGIAPFLVSSSVILVIAQRLARTICTQCKAVDTTHSEAFLKEFFVGQSTTGLTLYKGKGCETCNQTGYKGRMALYEVLPIREALRGMILEGASVDAMKAKAIALGMKTIRMSGMEKVRAGLTTPEEIIQNTFAD